MADSLAFSNAILQLGPADMFLTDLSVNDPVSILYDPGPLSRVCTI